VIERDKQNELITQALKRIWMTDDGKVLDKFLRRKCNMDNTTVCKSNPNLQQVLVEEGKRIVYLDLMWYLNEGYKMEKDNES